ncbi:MAG TPA: hypothetical protein VHA52_01245 [Candidatus Babeliaceae bacterium]|nr:hypothetical protein [Candidatus Babeliaceae bacterium]
MERKKIHNIVAISTFVIISFFNQFSNAGLIGTVLEVIGQLSLAFSQDTQQGIIFIANNSKQALSVKIALSDCTNPSSITVQSCELVYTTDFSEGCEGVQDVTLTDPTTGNTILKTCWDSTKTTTSVLLLIDESDSGTFSTTLYVLPSANQTQVYFLPSLTTCS